jgi:N-acetylmuramoyl-L-alanine amidase
MYFPLNSFFFPKKVLEIKPAPEVNPHYSNQTITPTFILLHCSGYEDPQATWIANNVSTHYLIPQQRSEDTSFVIAYEVVKVPLRAWHAGVSQWRNYTGLNDYAIGIEISMPNYARALMNETLDFKYFEAFQRSQITALILLIQKLKKEYSIPAENILGHADVAPWRLEGNNTVLGKTDPGPTLPWKQLSAIGISEWVDQGISCLQSPNLSVEIAQKTLEKIGYAVEHTGVFDLKTNTTLGAYRLHYMPECHNTTTGYANNCYDEPFDASTLCSMHRVLESRSQPLDTTAFWIVGIVATGGTLLLAGMAISWLARNCARRNQSIREDDDLDEEEEDGYEQGYVALPQGEEPRTNKFSR